MPSFLTDEWFEQIVEIEHEFADLTSSPEAGSSDVNVSVVRGEHSVECHLIAGPGGASLRPGSKAEATTHLTVPWDAAVGIFVDRDMTDATAAMSDGSLVVQGDASTLMTLFLAAADGPDALEFQRRIRDMTDESRRSHDDVVAPVVDVTAFDRPDRLPVATRRASGENIVLITTDQQRFDSLSGHGNPVCDTPAIDGLLSSGTDYQRAHVQNVLCTPSRSTILTGQYPATHGVWSNGVALPHDAASVADVLADAGYATAHIGKQHFEPPNVLAAYLSALGADRSWTGPYRGFDHVESSDHGLGTGSHSLWLEAKVGLETSRAYAEEVWRSLRETGGDTAAPQALYSGIPPELHGSTWVVDRSIDWIGGLRDDQAFFMWVSFDDPHHPFNPPTEYGRRHNWRDIDLPGGRPVGRDAIEAALASKPRQYMDYWTGEMSQHEGSLGDRPGEVSDDQLREYIALTAGMIELIDDNIARLLAYLTAKGLDANTHVFFTSDHGELLGDHGLLFKGPFHVDALLHVALGWRRPDARPATITDPVGLIDLAPTFCTIAGISVPEWMEGVPLPDRDGDRERVLTVYDSHYRPELALRTMFRDDRVITTYPRMEGVGEFYDLSDDPYQFVNRWEDSEWRKARDDLAAELLDHVVEDKRATPLRWWQHA